MSRMEMIIFIMRYCDGADIKRLNRLSTQELRSTFIRLKSAKLKLLNDRSRFGV